jgi:hypothetical protein
MVGKWHLGLKYRNADGGVADGWDDADLTQPLADCPLDHGFDFFLRLLAQPQHLRSQRPAQKRPGSGDRSGLAARAAGDRSDGQRQAAGRFVPVRRDR